MQRCYTKIAVHEDHIFMIDGPIWTSAGMSAGVDLALALLADDLGADLAQTRAAARPRFPPMRRVSPLRLLHLLWTRGANNRRAVFRKRHHSESFEFRKNLQDGVLREVVPGLRESGP